MKLVPESDEVITESLDNLVEALDQSVMAHDLSVAREVLCPKFLQGGPHLVQHTVVILGTLFTYLEVLDVSIEDFSFVDLWREDSDAVLLMDDFFWTTSESAQVVENLLMCFRRGDIAGFRQAISDSYFLGFDFFAAWFLPLVACMAVVGELGASVLEENGGDEEHSGG